MQEGCSKVNIILTVNYTLNYLLLKNEYCRFSGELLQPLPDGGENDFIETCTVAGILRKRENITAIKPPALSGDGTSYILAVL